LMVRIWRERRAIQNVRSTFSQPILAIMDLGAVGGG
jgi:hypothetical protein